MTSGFRQQHLCIYYCSEVQVYIFKTNSYNIHMAIFKCTFACLPVSTETSLAGTLVGAGKVGAVSICITGVRTVRALVDVWKI